MYVNSLIVNFLVQLAALHWHVQKCM